MLALLFAATVLVQEVTAQIVGEVLLTFMANAFFVMAPRLAMLYAPSELFGTYSGGIFLFLGISQLVLTPLVDAAASLTLVVLAGLTHPGARYRFGLVLWSCVVVLTAPPLYRHWRDHPPPGSRNGLPPLPTMADVREARAQHAARRTAERRAKPAGERSRLLPGGAPRLGAGSRGGEPRQERTHTGV